MPRHSLSSRRRKITVVFAAVGGLVLLGVIAAGGYLWKLDHTVERNLNRVEGAFPDESDRPAPAAASNGQAPLTVLLLGSDARPQGSAVTGQRSDAMMIVHVNGARDRVDVMSIPRDSWVDVPGHGKAKINSAYANGGFPLAVHTVEDLLGVRIDHVAAIDMNGFKDMTDALGGVDVKVVKPFTAFTGHRFTAGTHHVNGDEALAFVRERKHLGAGDLDRTANQQRYLQAVFTQALSRDTLTNPGQLSAFIDATTRHLTVDDQLTGKRLRGLAFESRGLRGGDVHFSTVPVAGVGTSGDGQSIVKLDQAGIHRLAEALQNDAMAAYSP